MTAFIFGEMYEKDQNGNIHKLINDANIKAGNGIVLDKSEVDKARARFNLGIPDEFSFNCFIELSIILFS